jgi:hypothetical protein
MEREKTAFEMEQEELNLLVNKGIKFSIKNKVRKREKGWRGFFGKKDIVEETNTYEIHEPTLSVLDRISDVSLKIAINEDELKDGNVLRKAKKLAKENAEHLARVIAIAVLGEDYYINEITGKRHNDDKELNRLTDLFLHTITPSKLVELSAIITSISNLGDFLNSMRLLSDARTTIPRKESIE